MQLLASTFRNMGHEARAVAFNTDFRGFETDFFIPHQSLPVKRAAFMFEALSRYDVFHFFWGVSLLDFWRFYGIDLPILRALKKKIIIHFRGSDVVNLQHYVAGGDPSIPKSSPRQIRKIQYWKRYAHEVLVSTPNLLDVVGPGARVVPQVIDTNYWKGVTSQVSSPSVTIVHAPTRRSIKGTPVVIRVVENLSKLGLEVRLRLLEGLPYSQIREEMSKADIGIDQLVLGWYGKVAIELMALGKPVVSFIDPALEVYARGLPIVSADEESLQLVLNDLVVNKNKREELGMAGISYAASKHDVKLVARDLICLYDSI